MKTLTTRHLRLLSHCISEAETWRGSVTGQSDVEIKFDEKIKAARAALAIVRKMNAAMKATLKAASKTKPATLQEIARARETYEKDGEGYIVIYDEALADRPEDGSVWVQGWVQIT